MSQAISTLKNKLSAQTVMAFLLLVFGMVIVMCSLYLPPQGEIHPTVITVFGMVLVAAGTFVGVDLNFQLKRFSEIIKESEGEYHDSPVSYEGKRSHVLPIIHSEPPAPPSKKSEEDNETV